MADLRFKTLEKNKLWVKWEKTVKPGNGTVELINAEFYGPVTTDYLPLEDSFTMKLDFTNHFALIAPSFYIVNLTWDSVKSQQNGSIKFDKIVLDDTNVGLLNKIKDRDLLLIDCTGHTDKDHAVGNYKIVFDTMLYKEGKEPYDFTK